MSQHFHLLEIKEICPETTECVSVVLSVPENLNDTFKYLPGQYLTLKKNINGEEVRRSYSICSDPSEAELRVAIKHVENGKFSGFANKDLKVGDSIEVMPPLGNFTPEKNNGTTSSKHYLAFVAGSGITPVYGIIKHILKTEPNSTFTLVYGNKNRSSIIFKEGLEALKNRYMNRLVVHHIFTREKMDVPLFNGRINAEKAEKLSKLIDYNTINEIFICGPEEMIHSLRDYFIDSKKMDKHKLHFELFSSPDQPKTVNPDWIQKQKEIDTTKKSKVTVKLDGVAFDFDLAYGGESILDAALQQGADLPFACKGGVCCTCRAKLVEGSVDMEVNYALEDDELKNNYILTCQSHPRSEKVVIDFDIK